MGVDEWYNAVQAQINLAKYVAETTKILHRDIFWFFLRDEEFVSKTINDSNIDLEKFPASKVRQLAKKLESSKSKARHIKKMSNEPQATQVNIKGQKYHQTRPRGNNSRITNLDTKTLGTQMKVTNTKHHTRMKEFENKKVFNARQILQSEDRCHKCGDSKHIERFQCSACKYQCRNCHKFGHFSSLCYKKQESYKKRPREPTA